MIINKSNIHKYIIGTSLNCYNQGITSIEDISDYTPMETHTVGITHICCSYNKLTSLVGSPSQVGGMFYCYRNNLTSLEFSPDYVGGNFSCGKNNLTSLVGCPKEVGGDFDCIDNDLTDLTGLDRFNGKFYCTGNPIESIFNEVEQDFTYAFQEYKVIKDDTVYLKKLEYVMNQFHMDYDIEKIEVFYKIAEY